MASVTTAAATVAASVLGAMYLDAKYLFRHDLTHGALASVSNSAIEFIEQRFKEDRMTVYDNVEFNARSPTIGPGIFLMFEGRTWTYRQFYNDLQRVGNWLMNDLGIQRGDMVALDGTNSPEYIMMWLGLEAIGAMTAFVNCNLTGKPLLHCIKLCGAKCILVDSDVKPLVDPVDKELREMGAQPVYYDANLVATFKDTTELPKSRRSGIRPEETSNLIYTSGTTGLPKGTNLIRGRELNIGRGTSMFLGLKPGDRMYTCLPLYHGAGHGLCVTPSIHAGSTVVLSRKFSHKTFWPEVRESQAQTIQYVGELCRYLINAPPHPLDKAHNVKMAWGNGMRPDVWEVFRNRFGIETITELYAATDGIGGSFNTNRGDFGKFAIGKRGLIWHLLNSKNEKRIKVDTDTQEIIRGSDGFAIECKDGEPGEMVIRMNPAMAVAQFAGYFNNAEAGEKRKIKGLFQQDDLWFRSGDLLRQDPDGCVYFVDRLGDTFRWKSENVSTNEVSDVIGSFDQVAESNVYGVEVPFSDGRCGCAAIVMVEGITEQQFNFDKLAQHALSILPRYAVPIFVRIVKELEYTGTMKLQKGRLRGEGIDPKKVSAKEPVKDALYWLPPGHSSYVPFKEKEWAELSAGKVRL